MNFKSLFLFEIELLFRSPLQFMSLLVIVAVIVISVFIGIIDYGQRGDNEAEWLSNINRMIEKTRGVYSVKENFYVVDRAPSQYVFSKGMFGIAPPSILLPNTQYRYMSSYNTLDVNYGSMTAGAGGFDFTTMMSFVISLVVMVSGYSLVCGDKESGTLKMIMANSISRPLYFISKYLGRMFSLILVYIIAILISLLITFFMVDQNWPSLISYLFTITILGLGLIVTFYTISVAVSAMVHSPKSSMIICIVIWLILQISPQLIDKVIQASYSSKQGITQLNSQIMGFKGDLERNVFVLMAAQANRFLDQGMTFQEANIESVEVVTKEQGELLRSGIDNLLLEYQNRIENMIDMQQLAYIFIPSKSFEFTMSDISNTGSKYFLARDGITREYSKDLSSYIERKSDEFYENGSRGRDKSQYMESTGRFIAMKGDEIDLSDRPKFDFSEIGEEHDSDSLFYTFLSFIVWTSASLAIGWNRMSRYDLR